MTRARKGASADPKADGRPDASVPAGGGEAVLASGAAGAGATPAEPAAPVAEAPALAERISAAADSLAAIESAGGDAAFVLVLTSSRAPYRRGGVRFISTREPVTIGENGAEGVNLIALSADPAITVEIECVATNRRAVVPAGLVGSADPEDQVRLAELLADLVVPDGV